MRAPLFAFLVVTSPALAQDVKLAVTPLDGLGVDAALLAKLDAALAREVRDLKVTAVDADAVRAQKACDGEPSCLADVGRAVGASRVLAGSVGLAGDELHIALKLIDVVNGDESRSIDEAAPVDQAELRVRAVATKLLKPDKYNQSGSIIVSVPLTGAEVVVDGSMRGTTPLFGPIDGLPPGRREVEVRYAGTKPWRGFVDLRFGEPQRIELNIVETALVQVPRGAEPMSEQPPEAEPPILLLSGVGVVAIGTVTGIAAIFAYDATENSFATINTGEDTSAEKRAEYRAYYATCGALTAVSVAAVVGGVGLIVFSVME